MTAYTFYVRCPSTQCGEILVSSIAPLVLICAPWDLQITSRQNKLKQTQIEPTIDTRVLLPENSPCLTWWTAKNPHLWFDFFLKCASSTWENKSFNHKCQSYVPFISRKSPYYLMWTALSLHLWSKFFSDIHNSLRHRISNVPNKPQTSSELGFNGPNMPELQLLYEQNPHICSCEQLRAFNLLILSWTKRGYSNQPPSICP